MGPLDTFQRPLGSLRLSVTDRCNLRCGYCMPEEEYTWLPKRELLSFEELTRVVRATADLGVSKVRLTGGEPLLRRDLERLVADLAALPHVTDLALTTNAVLLEDQAAGLHAAGLTRLSISLDTLRADRFEHMTRRKDLGRTLAGIAAARRAGFVGTKLNTVVVRGENDDEVFDLLEFARTEELEVRFIEYMDVGGATRWNMGAVLSARELLARLAARYGAIEPIESEPSAPADRFRLPDGLVFGVIASTTQPFCGTCDRARVTADGRFFTCLYAREGLALAPLLRGEGDQAARDARVAEALRERWTVRADRGAEARLALATRDPLAAAAELRRDPHLEMHTRGG
ncbi:MAG: GTP 3',8-cyclase MoaA [Planctomycetota bacterium]